MFRTAYNPTDAPVVIDDEGRTLEGLAWGPVRSTAEEVRGALERGTLVLLDTDTDTAGELDPQAREALDATAELEAARRAGELTGSGLTPDGLARLTVEQVRRHVADHPDELAQVLEWEAAGRARAGVLELEPSDPDHEEPTA